MSTTEFPDITRPRLLPTMSAFAPPPDTADPLPCPRCDSTQTKFCYYNNYNLSQPRHFCKSCRRYWTRGGTLRNVPVGGGCRKKPKLSHRRASSSKSNSSGSPSSSSLTHDSAPNKPTSDSAVEKPDLPLPLPSDQQQVLSLTDNVVTQGGVSSMMTMNNTQVQPGFLSLGGYGYGSAYAHGFTQGFRYGARAAGIGFPMEMSGGYSVPVVTASAGLDVNTWQMPVADHEVQGGGLVGWPEIQILDSIPAVTDDGDIKEHKVATSSANPCLDFPEY